MELLKIKISEDLTKKLRLLKSRTGLTPNILCRIGLCLSLNEPGIPDLRKQPEDGMEFNRYTLTGQYDILFTALLKERCIQDGFDPDEEFTTLFVAHLNRGAFLLFSRIRTLPWFGL